MKKFENDLRQTGFYDATYRRWLAHIAACRNLNCPDLIVPFQKFALEVLQTPALHRADLLAETALPAPEPRRRYEQYVSPQEERGRGEVGRRRNHAA